MILDDLPHVLFSTDKGRRAGYGVVGMMGIFVLISGFRMFNDWYHDITLAISPPSLSQKTDLVLQQVAHIPDMHLFGKQGRDETGFLPITSLQIRLVGVLKAETEDTSKVLISESGKPGRVYQIGDVLESGVRIEAITENGVVLENAGHLEKLPLQRPSLLFQGKPKSLLQGEE